MYEGLATATLAVGDEVTARLTTEIQAEEKSAPYKIWQLVSPTRLSIARFSASRHSFCEAAALLPSPVRI